MLSTFLAAIFATQTCVVTLEQSPGPAGFGPAERFYERETTGQRYALNALPADCIVVSATNGGREGMIGEDGHKDATHQ